MAETMFLSPLLVSAEAFWFHLPVTWGLVLVTATAAAS